MVRAYQEYCCLPHSTFPVPVLTALKSRQEDNAYGSGTGPFVGTKLQNELDVRSFQAWLVENKVGVIDQISQKDVVVVPCSWIIKTFSTKSCNSTEGLSEDSKKQDKPEVGDFVVWVNNFMIVKVESISATEVEKTENNEYYATISYCHAITFPIKDSEQRQIDQVQVPFNQLLSFSQFLKLQNISEEQRKNNGVIKLVIWNEGRVPMLCFQQESTLSIPPEEDVVVTQSSQVVTKQPKSYSSQENGCNQTSTPTMQHLSQTKLTQKQLEEMEWSDLETKEEDVLEQLSKSSGTEGVEEKYKVVEKPKKKKKNKNKATPGTSKPSEDERKHCKTIQVYGHCYEIDNKYFLRDLKPDEIQVGDLVIAKWTNQGIVGQVKRICRIVRFRDVKEIMVGIQFDEPLTDLGNFVKITHIFDHSYWYGIYETCRHDRWIFIELDVLLNKENNIFILQRQTSSKTLKKPIGDIDFDIKSEAGRREIFKTDPINITAKETKIEKIGIQGNYNSCYADSFLFSIFAFTSAFDQYIFRNLSNAGESKEKFLFQNAVQNIVQYDIVNPLRRNLQVSWEAIQKLRNVLAEHVNPSFKDKMMDVEEFALTLFEDILKAPGFFRYDTRTTDHIHQIFTSKTGEINPESFSNLENLLIESFAISGVKLATIPNPGFLVKLPVYDGVPVFKRVFINPILSLENLLEKAEKKAELHLRAVICLQNKHFTCFVKPLKDLTRKQHWIYFDSLPEDEKTFCFEIPDIDSKIGKEWANKLMSTCYLCIYESTTATNEYKEEGEGTCV